jgi:RHS repeat-associated protein
VKKIRADGREEVLQYYPNLNRLHHVTTSGVTRRVYTYTNDESIDTVTYHRRVPESDPPQFVNDPYTPAVSYAYDSVHDRTTSVSSSVGSISYQYHPYRQSPQAAVLLGAGALSRVETSVLNGTDPAAAILYQYDALGRTSSRAIQSFIDNEWTDDNHSVAWQYDAVSRLTSMTNVLGEFEYEYDQPAKGLSRLASVTYPNGQVTSYDWHPAAQHHRLAAITHRKADTTLISEYGYNFSKGGQLRTWTQQVGADPLEHWQIEHDEAEQLRSVIAREGGPTGTILRQQFYNYDPAGNRTGYQDGHSIRPLAYNHLNQIIDPPTGGPVRFEGTIDEPGTVSINEQSATMRTVLDENEDPTFRFAADVPLSTGFNQVTIEATDGSSNTASELYDVTVTELTGQTAPAYDSRGNMTSNGRGQSYEWDTLNRLLAIQYADGSRTEFTYDAFSRRMRILEKDDQGDPVTDKRLLWEGTGIAQERGAGNTVIKRYSTQGLALADDTTYFYTRDHLGSIRQVTDEGEAVVEHYTYDPYGVPTASAPGGPNNYRLADFRYTGHYHHEKSNLHLAMYRAYDAELGVWISEDPIEEEGGINLYRYVGNASLLVYDLLGLRGYPSNFTGPLLPGDYYIPDAPNGVSVDANIRKALHMNPVQFYCAVQNKGPWDYKQPKNGGPKFENFGNFNFGATAAAAGFSLRTALREAGRAQIRDTNTNPKWGSPGSKWNRLFPFGCDQGSGTYGDDPVDAGWIKRGYEYFYDNGGAMMHMGAGGGF